MWLGLGMLCQGGMWEAGGPVSHLCYCAIWVFSFCNPGPFRVLCELVGPDRKEACVSRAGSRQAVPQIHCVRVR